MPCHATPCHVIPLAGLDAFRNNSSPIGARSFREGSDTTTMDCYDGASTSLVDSGAGQSFMNPTEALQRKLLAAITRAHQVYFIDKVGGLSLESIVKLIGAEHVISELIMDHTEALQR